MDLKRIEKLGAEIDRTSFEKSNKSKNVSWMYTSYLFQFLNIIICFFGLFLFLSKVIPDFIFKTYIIGGISFTILFFWEKLKRETIRSTVINYNIDKQRIKKGNILNVILCCFLIICSSLIAIKGGSEISDKETIIESNVDNKITIKTDSITNYYLTEINKLEVRQKYIYDNAIDRRNNKRSLNNIELSEVKSLDDKIITLKSEQENKVNKFENKLNSKKDAQNLENKNIVTIFVVSSIVFELFIIIGIVFCSIYDFKSYHEIINDDNYKKKILFTQYLNIFYINGKAVKDEKCLSEVRFTEMIKMKNKTVNLSSVKDFINVLYFTKCIYLGNDKRRYYSVEYTEASELLNEYFKNN
jgi:hypothetical protein